MRAFRDLPIRLKVATLIAVASLFGLGLAALAVVVYEISTFRPRVLADARAQANIIGVNSIPALVFGDSAAAAENLATLEARPAIGAAALYRSDGQRFAAWTRFGRAEQFSPPAFVPGSRFTSGWVQVVERLEDDGQHVGWITLRMDLPPVWQRLPQYGIMVGVVVVALGAAAILLLSLLGRSVSRPLLELAGIARTVSETGDPQLRVPRHAHDEIGDLTDAFNRMLARLEAQQHALQQSETRLRVALEAAAMESWSLELGDDPGPLEEFLASVHPEDREAVAQAVARAKRQGGAVGVEFRREGAGEPVRWIALSGQVQHTETGRRIVGVLQDVTERRRLEQQLIQSQKMEAIGNLAGGIAHDFNNLLTGMMGYLAFAERSTPPGSQLQSDIRQVQLAAERAAALTSQLLAYSRRQMVIPTLVDLNRSVRTLEPLLRRVLGEHIRIEVALDPALGTARVDAGQLEQVLMNLAVNARDAMPDGGTLRIATRNVMVDAARVQATPELRQGPYVALEVADTGTGMTPDVLARIFEPFFTTKPQGQGTGLGLAMCYGIVRQADGHIEVESEPGRGSRFTILLPRVTGAPAPAESAAAPAARPSSGTVLVVEDDETVRELAARTLRETGYTVLEADSADEAIAAVEVHAGTVDLLLTDIILPGRSGRDLAEELRRRRPGLQALFMSGYAGADAGLQDGVPSGTGFVAKPFTPEALTAAVRGVLRT